MADLPQMQTSSEQGTELGINLWTRFLSSLTLLDYCALNINKNDTPSPASNETNCVLPAPEPFHLLDYKCVNLLYSPWALSSYLFNASKQLVNLDVYIPNPHKRSLYLLTYVISFRLNSQLYTFCDCSIHIFTIVECPHLPLTKPCKHCGEMSHIACRKCPYCGESFGRWP